jgi:hypothetical protein
VFLFQELEHILLKAPFQLVPQYTMKRRSITLGVEQVAELMQRLSKKAGLLESIGIDFDAIPSREDVVLTNNDNRIQKQQMEKASRGKKRQRVQELEETLTDAQLPDRKRLRTMDYLRKALKRLHASVEKEEKPAVPLKTKRSKPKEQTEVSREQWKKCHRMIASRLFFPPRDARKNWNGVITTDGISCSWHQIKERLVVPCARIKSKTQTKPKQKTTSKTKTKTPPKTKTKKQAPPIEIVSISSLGPSATDARPKDYGTHGDTVWIEPGPLTIIAVDPGHATLVDAVRYHPDGVRIEPLPIDASQRQKRRHRLKQKLGSNDPK